MFTHASDYDLIEYILFEKSLKFHVHYITVVDHHQSLVWFPLIVKYSLVHIKCIENLL